MTRHRHRNTPRISVAGDKDSGKTTLIEQLVSALKKDGHRVGVIKYARREIQIDREGKDTYRFYQSGADAVFIASPDKMALIKRIDSPPPVDEVLDAHFSDADMVFLEGYKGGDCPEIYLVAPGKEPAAEEQAPGGRDRTVLELKVLDERNPISQEVFQKALNFVSQVMKGVP